MRLLFIILAVANLVLLGYAVMQSHAPPADGPLAHQIQPQQIRIVPAPSPTAERTSSCLQWGTFAEADLDRVRRDLVASLPAGRWSEAKIPVTANWWVYIPPASDRGEAERKLRQLAALGVQDYYLVDAEGPWRNAISLGVFKSEDAASAFLQGLRAKGVRSARVGSREHRLMQTAVVMRDPDAELSARVAEMALRFPGSELRAGSCPAIVTAR